MKHLLILAGIGALAATTPAVAKPDHARGHGAHGIGHGVGGCPPGLAKKGCLPPGQAKKLYGIGHRFDRGFAGWTPYNQIPYDLRRHYGLSPQGRYIYDRNYVYQVDPTTYAVSRILSAILR